MVELQWQGPFPWPGTVDDHRERSLEGSEFGDCCGVYLWTVEYEAGFLIYAAGITRRPFRERFRGHTRSYRTGVYTVFDAASLRRGKREIVWPGFWFGEQAADLERECQTRGWEIRGAVLRLLAAYRVFVAPAEPVPRVFERTEAAIMNGLYAVGGAVAEVPDRGMALSPRWNTEAPILVRSITAELPSQRPGWSLTYKAAAVGALGSANLARDSTGATEPPTVRSTRDPCRDRQRNERFCVQC